MNNPTIADIKPAKVSLEKGTDYFFCSCGKSANQPFCDGSHLGTQFTPKKFTAKESGDAFLCQCKQSSTQPFCDSTHKKFTSAMIGSEGPELSSDKNKIPTTQATPEEPHVAFIHQLAKEGLSNMGHHGPMGAMGVPREKLPKWDDIQIMVAQLARKPLMEDTVVRTDLVIGPETKKPLELAIPLFVSDMSFGALSEEAKVALAKGAQLAGTGICSGEGGMLPEEQAANSHYFYELASAMFGYSEEHLTKVQAFHFKAGQGAKTGTGGHLPATKNVGKISEVRGIPAGQPAISPPTFADMSTVDDFRTFADRVREISGGIPIGFKLSANHIERDMAFALKASADYIIIDGRGGGTGAAPLMFRDHISVPTIPALARARAFLDREKASGRVTLITTGGLRTHTDFYKAMALGADGVAISNSAIQAIGCIGARMCNTNNCPAGIATQKPELRARLKVDEAAEKLARYLSATVELMQVMARACGHRHLSQINLEDIATFNKGLAELSGIFYSGHTPS